MMDPHGPINLSHVQRCDQDWATMPPMPGGRLCQQCSKRIVDFTRMSDAEIAQAHWASDLPICGMYREDQLQLKQPRGRAHGSWRGHPARFSLVSLLLLEPSLSPAQDERIEQVAPQADVKERAVLSAPVLPATADPVIIRGQVTVRGEPVPYVVVSVKGTSLSMITSWDGRFALDLSEIAKTQQRVVVVMRCIGYTAMEQEVDLQRPADMIFNLDDAVNSEVAYAVTIKRIPLYKRIWWGIQRPFRR
ncbi:MAG: carboxypeptidase-like regulatory domain-containing protein [Flavobacteriales bacterium]|nr:carboxypeptidase-like regulatory domain-containing protein [Flavobacteriales bacterium]